MTFERPDILRPPSEARSYFLPLTRGCSNNTCTYCGFYNCKLKVRDIAEVKEEIDALTPYREHNLRLPHIPDVAYYIARQWDGRRVFLQDGDALVYPFSELVEVLQYLNEKLPGIERIASYATPQDILRRDLKQLKELKDLKLGILYMGVESGDDEVLEKIGKGVNHDQMVEAGRKIKEAGILSSVTVILGLGGKQNSESHTRETARVLTEMDPDYVGALTLSLIPGTPMYEQHKNGVMTMLTPFEFLKELKTIIEESSFTNCFFSSMHASNYVAVRGTLPGDKGRVTGELERVLRQKDAAILRPEFLRGL